jgi:hypothetical protein
MLALPYDPSKHPITLEIGLTRPLGLGRIVIGNGDRTWQDREDDAMILLHVNMYEWNVLAVKIWVLPASHIECSQVSFGR